MLSLRVRLATGDYRDCGSDDKSQKPQSMIPDSCEERCDSRLVHLSCRLGKPQVFHIAEDCVQPIDVMKGRNDKVARRISTRASNWRML